MIQIRPGDLVSVLHDDSWYRFAILVKQILFGGHWCFVYSDASSAKPTTEFDTCAPGFNAFADFLSPKRQGRVIRVSRANDFSSLYGPELLVQQPARSEVNFRVWRWKDKGREGAEYVRYTPSPTQEERCSPEYACFQADMVCELVKRGWRPGERWWLA
jgi:hypothetical protein